MISAFEIYSDPKSHGEVPPEPTQSEPSGRTRVESIKRRLSSKKAPKNPKPPSEPQKKSKLLPTVAARFKETFSRKVKVHFVGVWYVPSPFYSGLDWIIIQANRDTVSSIGIVRGKTLPGTDDPEHICYFRHALALDERRVKFLPEYARGGVFLKEDTDQNSERRPSVGADGEDAGQPRDSTSKRPAEDDAGPSSHPRVKETWFTGTHSDM